MGLCPVSQDYFFAALAAAFSPEAFAAEPDAADLVAEAPEAADFMAEAREALAAALELTGLEADVLKVSPATVRPPAAYFAALPSPTPLIREMKSLQSLKLDF